MKIKCRWCGKLSPINQWESNSKWHPDWYKERVDILKYKNSDKRVICPTCNKTLMINELL